MQKNRYGLADFKVVPKEWRERIPEYVKDYVSLNRFMSHNQGCWPVGISLEQAT